jgi:hypothetical protein
LLSSDVPNLFVVETVDSTRIAKAINDALQKLNKQAPLKVMAQVNTSGEESKYWTLLPFLCPKNNMSNIIYCQPFFTNCQPPTLRIHVRLTLNE